MKEGADFHSPPSPDDPHDPLLAALREHLGESFGQEPPAALWAGIRQQLPGVPRPWWRSRRLLPLLALLAGIVALGVFSARQSGWLGGHATTRLATGTSAAGSRAPETAVGNHTKTTASQPANEQASSESLGATTVPGASVQPRAALGPAPGLPSAAGLRAPIGSARARKTAAVATPAGEQSLAAMREQPTRRVGEALPKTEPDRRARHLGLAALPPARQYPGTPGQQRAGFLAAQPAREPLGTFRQALPTSAAAERRATYSSANAAIASGSTRKRNRRGAARTASLPTHSESADVHSGLGAQPTATLGKRSAPAASSATGSGMAAAIGPPAALDSLASRRATLLLAAASRPTALVSPADSPTPWFLPARRWSVLVLAGPTLSFRTVRSATVGGLVVSAPIAIPPQSFNNLNGARTTSASVVDLERPAAGQSAQVQVRRVLTGRWALAFGAGYQEYATRLALQVTKRTILPASPASSASYLDSTFSVRHRDTYRLLTLPLQLSYALGPPRGRLSLGLLGGLEPGWYVGGRTTEGTSCNCEQQTFSSASGSPYNAFSLGLSLGLDARYRLGGPASRWQWVLQPTGRYVASPFVRSSTLYARRQPYSLGLLTGLAWEF